MKFEIPTILTLLVYTSLAYTPPRYYLVKLKDDVSPQEYVEHINFIVEEFNRGINWDELNSVNPPLNPGDGILKDLWVGTFMGYGAHVGLQMIDIIRNNPVVELVEEDKELEKMGVVEDAIFTSRQRQAPWGLRRISHSDPVPEGDDYVYRRGITGKGMFAYLIDTGIRISHQDFGSNIKDIRFRRHPDGDGHGTAMAGIIASKTHGMLKHATVLNMGVVGDRDCPHNTGCQLSLLRALIESARDILEKKILGRAVIVTGMGATDSRIINLAVDAIHREGILVVAPAGNDARGHIFGSPASSNTALTVGAIKDDDEYLVISNHGPRVDIFAPGNRIQSPGAASDTEVSTVTGTSFAAAYVAGLALYILQMNPRLRAEELKGKILDLGLKDKIKNLPPNTANRISYNNGGMAIKV